MRRRYGGECGGRNSALFPTQAGFSAGGRENAAPPGRQTWRAGFTLIELIVVMAYADGHISLLSESVDGAAYAALASPQGLLLDQSAIQQVIVSSEGF